jgi:precorrin-6B methylase 2
VSAADRWREQLAAWAIPDEIIEAAPESPYGFSSELFGRRGAGVTARTVVTPTTARGLEALPERGSILDVGVGGGAISLPLAPHVGSIIGVDAQEDMLDVFRTNASVVDVDVRTVLGAWPDVASDVEMTDLVLVGHVVYNVADLGPFVQALDAHARFRVVLELTERHPLEWMNDLWMNFHGLDRPTGPTVDDALTVLADIGIDAQHESRPVTAADGAAWFASREDAIHLVRKRLCLPADRDAEIGEALGDRLREVGALWDVGPQERTIATLWWDRA